MTSEVHAHIVMRLKEMLSLTMMGDLTFREPRIVDSNSVGMVIKATAITGLNEWDQPIGYPVVLLVTPELPADEPPITPTE